MAIRNRLQQLFLQRRTRYEKILNKRDQMIDILPRWKENHFYPKWLRRDYKKFKKNNKQLLIRKRPKRQTSNNNTKAKKKVQSTQSQAQSRPKTKSGTTKSKAQVQTKQLSKRVTRRRR